MRMGLASECCGIATAWGRQWPLLGGYKYKSLVGLRATVGLANGLHPDGAAGTHERHVVKAEQVAGNDHACVVPAEHVSPLDPLPPDLAVVESEQGLAGPPAERRHDPCLEAEFGNGRPDLLAGGLDDVGLAGRVADE